MKREKLIEAGFTYVKTNTHGTQYFIAPNGDDVRCYTNGYVRKYPKTNGCYQMNLTKVTAPSFSPKTGKRISWGGVERIMLPTKAERYQRLFDWNENVTKKSKIGTAVKEFLTMQYLNTNHSFESFKLTAQWVSEDLQAALEDDTFYAAVEAAYYAADDKIAPQVEALIMKTY